MDMKLLESKLEELNKKYEENEKILKYANFTLNHLNPRFVRAEEWNEAKENREKSNERMYFLNVIIYQMNLIKELLQNDKEEE